MQTWLFKSDLETLERLAYLSAKCFDKRDENLENSPGVKGQTLCKKGNYTKVSMCLLIVRGVQEPGS